MYLVKAWEDQYSFVLDKLAHAYRTFLPVLPLRCFLRFNLKLLLAYRLPLSVMNGRYQVEYLLHQGLIKEFFFKLSLHKHLSEEVLTT